MDGELLLERDKNDTSEQHSENGNNQGKEKEQNNHNKNTSNNNLNNNNNNNSSNNNLNNNNNKNSSNNNLNKNSNKNSSNNNLNNNNKNSSNSNINNNSNNSKINIDNSNNDNNNNNDLPNHLISVDTQNKSNNVKKSNNNINTPTSNILSRRSTFKKRHSDVNVLVGTPIKEDHVHYVLMYDMLTGIRVAVSRCLAKVERPLQDQDFHAAHKLAFDIIGNELTPSSKYDFKFKDYAPWVFREIRNICNIDQADYLMSLTGKYVLSELGSPGKSGSFFYYSQDYRFIIKTVHHVEHKFLRKILKPYYEHIRDNPNTLICWIFGLHRVKLPHGKKIHFVVMQNILPPNKDIHERFDLKGSIQGRIVNDEAIKKDKSVVLKDLNWIKLRRRIKLGPEKRKIFIDQIERDAQLLAKLNIMDYSLLVGFHNLSKGNQENIRDKTLSIFEPNPESLSQQYAKVRQGSKAVVMRKAIAESDPVALGPSTTKLPEELPKERKYCIFYQDDGGFRSTDNNNKPLNDLYFLGVIDILTNYNYKKKIEHFIKSFNNDKSTISAIHPKKYAKRFVDFIKFATYPEEELNLPIFDIYLKIRESYDVQQSQEEEKEIKPVQTLVSKETQPLNGTDAFKKEEVKNIDTITEESTCKDDISKKLCNETSKSQLSISKKETSKNSILSKEHDEIKNDVGQQDEINQDNKAEDIIRLSLRYDKESLGSFSEYNKQLKDLIPLYTSTDLFVTHKSELPIASTDENIIEQLPQTNAQSNLSSKRNSMKVESNFDNSEKLA
ncbi:SAICAR synthase-like protein [Neocallimastix lanati (nom. inval.)]|uniref:1-phosphatidylinositol-4-phosphate 5-kinase n=1 Tax=Neocallimastix californiae TaxID=1754190 RepID=A0A1Y2CMX0_9FUNG|nr:SAICAR synthase-like protein [Neocallimastix sp. JGI-2020a]ORY48388.1 SAICAR synthase-like protein [Neocallimastix californiae]|eukprot:ORY48388.1 SAICAR synthase-like protein [Neocallimastix californiae]